jgi:2-amino-4-hydroxy-6-hydroxymethyldihydropteridine diphosphokinase
MPIVYLGLGSNLGERKSNLINAIARLRKTMDILKTSSLYETEPIGFIDQPLFLNMVCQVSTNLKPVALLKEAKIIEREMGREVTVRNGPRVIDIDILIYNTLRLNESDLILPHPRLTERAFVLVPLSEIAASLVHPITGKSIEEHARLVTGKDGVRKYDQEVDSYV